MLPKQGYGISKSFTIIIYLKIKRYIQVKIHNVSMTAVHLIPVRLEMIKALQYIHNKDLITYIKMLFKIKNNVYTMMM